MFATTLFTLLLFLLRTLANTTYHEFLSDDLASECEFLLGGRKYDLCPVFNGPSRIIDGIRASESDPATRMAYKLTLGGYHHFAEKDTRPSAQIRDCPEGTWICGTATSYHPHHPTEVVQVFPIAGKSSRTPPVEGTANAVAVLHSTSGAPLTLYLRGGFLRDRPQTARIEFVCDPDADEPSSPSFSRQSNDDHSFVWTTKHGCSHPITSSDPLLRILEDNPPSDGAPEDQTPGEEQELVPPMSPPSYSRRFTTVLLLTGTALIVISILFYFPPTPVRQCVQLVKRIHIPSQFPFRVGEVRLMRWAEEDMELVDEEEDFMVNANADGDGGLELADEYIPLKPSPRKNFMPNYGSARPW